MQKLFTCIVLMIIVDCSSAEEKLINFDDLLKRGSVNYVENRYFEINSIGDRKYSGPLYCSDLLLSGLGMGYKKDECSKSQKQDKYWIDLQVDEFTSEHIIRADQLKFDRFKIDAVRKFSARISFFESVAVFSFDGVVANSYAQTSFSNIKQNDSAINWVSFPHHCGSDRPLVADILENKKSLFQLSDRESRNLELLDVIGKSDYPYFLKYTDDDQVWGVNKAVANSGSNIYIFIGDKRLKIINEVVFGLCSPNGSFVKLIEENSDLGADLRYAISQD